MTNDTWSVEYYQPRQKKGHGTYNGKGNQTHTRTFVGPYAQTRAERWALHMVETDQASFAQVIPPGGKALNGGDFDA